jgi:large subunit ribosomal protein L4
MELAVYKQTGEDTGRKIKLSDSVFGIEPNDHAIYLDVKLYRANQRQGTHSSKERSQLSGSRRKIKRQKGTGTARMGDIKSPILRGGARAFGPHPRNYSFKLNKKVKRLARKSALTYKVQEKEVLVLEDFNLDQPKTKAFIDFLKKFELEGKKTLLVLKDVNANVSKSASNIQRTKVTTAYKVNTYELLEANKVIFVEGAVKELEEMFASL